VASGCIWAVGWRSMPRVAGHLAAARASTPAKSLGAVLREPNHWRAFGFTALVMSSGFTMIPFLTIYMTSNMGLQQAQLPLVYLAGGIATFFSARLIGAAADRWGKLPTFRAVAVGAMVPLMAIPMLGVVPLWMLIAMTTMFFVCVSGRMVPGMALITGAATPAVRGTFMSLNGSVQSAAMGIASLAGGFLIGRGADGRVTGFALCGALAVMLSAAAMWWAGRVRVTR
jgi:predicted MFS family arabinose efflux permease